jgi:transposase
MSRVEVMSGLERRRRWSEDQKRAIVAEAFGPGASVSEVARRSDIVAGQIYRWRRELGSAAAGFTEIVVSPAPAEKPTYVAPVIEIDFGRGIRVRIPVTTPVELASAIIKALGAR